MKLRFYETFYLLHPELNDEERSEISQKLQDIIAEKGGEVVKVDPWPLQKLAYKVNKQTHGYYVLMEYGAPGDAIEELTRNLRIDERVLKFTTVKKDDTFDPEAVKAEDTGAAETEEAAATETAETEQGEG